MGRHPTAASGQTWGSRSAAGDTKPARQGQREAQTFARLAGGGARPPPTFASPFPADGHAALPVPVRIIGYTPSP